jgi:SAM-dependent methyltransferase
MGERHGNRQKYASSNPIQQLLLARFRRCLVALVRKAAPQTILDLGCGEGFMLKALVEAGVPAELRGIDVSPAAVQEARARLGERAVIEVGNAVDLGASAACCDLVMMTEVLEHLPDPRGSLARIASLTRRWVLLSVPWEPYFRGLNLLRGKHVRAWGNDPEHIYWWSRSGFLAFVQQEFSLVEAPWVFPWTMILAERRSGPARTPAG